MYVLDSPTKMQRVAEEARRHGRSIGLVPTMGALHQGHLSLLRRCRDENELAVMTLFVNPAQFDRKDDLARYPRDFNADAALARDAGVDAIFAPTEEGMYPDGFETYVVPGRLASRWEGESRPGHFRGVATVCTKLFAICRPHRAYFGQKDYQQAQIVRRLAADLNLGLRVVVLPTVREADGLALSSRNRLLGPEQRREAVVLSRALFAAQRAAQHGEQDAERVRSGIRSGIQSSPLAAIDYVAVADPETLEPVERIGRRAVALVAARFGAIRLIDNVLLEPPPG
jgi:pantoate--beta-alanine ligase